MQLAHWLHRSNVRVPAWVHSLGYLDDASVPVLLNSLDTLVVLNRDSQFGNYSYPVKLYEAMSCGLHVTVSRTRSTEWILGDDESLVDTNDDVAVRRAIEAALAGDDAQSVARRIPKTSPPTE